MGYRFQEVVLKKVALLWDMRVLFLIVSRRSHIYFHEIISTLFLLYFLFFLFHMAGPRSVPEGSNQFKILL